MSTSALANREQLWRRDWFVGVLIVGAVIVLQYSTGVIETLEPRFYDDASTKSGRVPSERIAVIAIDDGERQGRPDTPLPASALKNAGESFAADLRAIMAAMSGQAAAAPSSIVTRPIAASAVAGRRAAPIEATLTPGYDPGQQLAAGEQANAFAKTAVFNSLGGSGTPSAWNGKADPDDKKPGQL